MTRTAPIFYDVFLSYAAVDRATAEVIEHKLADVGLAVFSISAGEVEDGAEPPHALAEHVRLALRESAALVILLTAAHRNSALLAFEVGAAWMGHKPIFVLLSEENDLEVPVYLRRFTPHPLDRLPDVIHALRQLARPLSDAERQTLATLYQTAGVPADQLLTDPQAAANLADALNQTCGVQLSTEEVLRELLRLRKQGRLPRLRRPKRLPT